MGEIIMTMVMTVKMIMIPCLQSLLWFKETLQAGYDNDDYINSNNNYNNNKNIIIMKVKKLQKW